MRKTSSSFYRGMVAGILLWAAVVGLGHLLAEVPAWVPASFKVSAIVNLVAGLGGFALVYGRERRASGQNP